MKPHLIVCMLLVGAVVRLWGQEGLVISEVLYQPRSGEAEYVELYNNSAQPVDLASYRIVRWTGDSLGRRYELPSHMVAAHDYVVLTTRAASVMECYHVEYPAKLVECSLPTYPNGGGSVVLCWQNDTVADRLDYVPTMHSRLLRNKAGVSLERRRFDRPTQEVGNWFSASSVSGYGTPGYRNSQSMEMLVEESGLRLSSTTISPDGDEVDDVLRIDYSFPSEEPLSARAEIYSLQGQMVRRLLNGDLIGTEGSVVWDGKGDNGQPLAEGHYVLFMVLYNREGAQQTIKRSVAIVKP